MKKGENMSESNYCEFLKKLIELKVVYYSKGETPFFDNIGKYQTNFTKNTWEYKLLEAVKNHPEGKDVNEGMFDEILCCINCKELIENYFGGFDEDDRNKYRLKEMLEKLEGDSNNIFPHQSETERSNLTTDVIFLVLMIKFMLLVERENFRKKFEKRPVREEILNRAEIVFTLIILATKLHPKNNRLFIYNQDEYLSDIIQLISYKYRGIVYRLKEMANQSINDCSKGERLAQNLLGELNINRHPITITKDKREKITRDLEQACKYYDEIIKILYLFILINKGDIFYSVSDFDKAFDCYCQAMREKKDLEDNWINKMKSENPNSKMRKIKLISLEIIVTRLRKGILFYEKGHFRSSLCWFFEALSDILMLATTSSIKRVETIEAFCNWLRLYTLSDSRIDKTSLEENLRSPFLKPCQTWNFIEKSKLKDNLIIKKLSSEIFYWIGLVLFTLKMDYILSNEFRSSCGTCVFRAELPKRRQNPNLVDHWFIFAGKLDSVNTLVKYYLTLCDLRSEGRLLPDTLLRGELPFNKDTIERDFCMYVLEQISEKIQKNKMESLSIEENILIDLITNIDNFITIPKEIYKNLSIPRKINDSDSYFMILRRWSSFTPMIPGPRVNSAKGGGYFLIWHGKGIVIDPGFDFLKNLYDAGYSLSDVDAIIMTHSHPDHTNDFIPILNLIYEIFRYRERIGSKENQEGLYIFLNQGTFNSYSHLLQALQSQKTGIREIHCLNQSSTFHQKEFLTEFKLCLNGIKAKHHEVVGENSIGVILDLKDAHAPCKTIISIGITGDTAYYSSLEDHYAKCNIICAHIGDIKFRDLIEEIKDFRFDRPELKGLFYKFKDDNIEDQIRLRSFLYTLGGKIRDKNNPFLDLIYKNSDFKAVLESIKNNDESKLDIYQKKLKKQYEGRYKYLEADMSSLYRKNHLEFQGVKTLYEKIKDDDKKIFIISEFGEGMRNFRNKIASNLNNYYKNGATCFTGDIGLKLKLGKQGQDITIQCSRCAQNNDLLHEYAFHSPKNIKEICIKSEDESMVYYCPHHDAKQYDNQPKIKKEFIERKIDINILSQGQKNV